MTQKEKRVFRQLLSAVESASYGRCGSITYELIQEAKDILKKQE